MANPNSSETSQASSLQKSLIALTLIVLVGVGVAFAGSYNGIRLGAVPVFAVIVVWIFSVQIVAFIPSWLNQTEKFFDLTGSITYVSAIIAGLLLSGHTDVTSILLTVAVSLWAARLGSFLFTRVRRSGSDDRFDEIKPSISRFLNVWMMQGLWVTVTISVALAAVTSASASDQFHPATAAGLLVWLIGFSIEILADTQKSKFKADPKNKGKFISTGIWSWSRHPNYFGEILLWSGIALAALSELRGWQYATLISPFFVTLLLTRISGIPLLEKKAEDRWGNDPAYRRYRNSTSLLIPLPPKKRPEDSEPKD